MNAMGHDVPTMIGVDHRDVAQQITKLVPDYMVMGERGMADMAEMEMPLPDNTAADDDRRGPVRLGRDGRHVHRAEGAARPEARRLQGPGWFKHPAGTLAYELTGRAAEPARFNGRRRASMPAKRRQPGTISKCRYANLRPLRPLKHSTDIDTRKHSHE